MMVVLDRVVSEVEDELCAISLHLFRIRTDKSVVDDKRVQPVYRSLDEWIAVVRRGTGYERRRT